MRAWPGKFDGLRLRLSSGWYSIPSYVSADERRLLVAMLVAGIAEIDHVVELDWDALEDAADKLQLTRALAFVRVPASVEPDGDALQRVRATLGSVRLGLLQYEAPGVWADVAWQEREVKVPLLTWLKRWLRNPAHPFAKLGIADLPIDEIAKLTAEPVELLMATEMVIGHRLRYRQQGMAPEDWHRSVMRTAAERLAGRFMQIPSELRSRALDLAMSGAEDPLVAALEDRDAGLALARVGLAWHGGNDLLLGPLASLASEPTVMRRLLELLPEDAWSEAGKQKVRRAVQVFLPPPRAAIIAPEPSYSEWPVVERAQAMQSWLSRDLGFDPDLVRWVRRRLENVLQIGPGRQVGMEFRDWPQCPQELRVAIDASLAMLEEIGDSQLLNLDFQRGRIHRFDGLDRAWAQFPAGNEARAYFRWIGLEQLLGRVRGQYRLDVLIGEAARTLKLVDSSSLLAVAIHGLRGDILARQGRYRLALESWGEARRFAPDKRTVKHLERRRLLAHIRLDETASVGVVRNKVGLRGDESSMAEIVRDLIGLGDVLLSIMRFNPQTTRGRGWRQWFDGQWWFNEDTLITEIAAALECGDWVQGIHLDMILQEENRPTSEHVFRAELLRAWMRASLGDLDSAHTSFENLLARAVADEERLAQAFAHRGLAAVAYLREQTEPAITSLAAALSIERELDLTDANLLELELTGWRVLAGELTIADYNTKLAESEGVASPSYEFARLDSYLRFVASSNAVIQAAELGDFIAAPFIGTLEKCVSLREHSPWIRPACRVAAELAGRLADAGMPDEATQIRDAVRQLAANDPDLLALIGE